MNSKAEFRNLLLALFLSTGIMLVWQVFYEAPRERVEKARLASQPKAVPLHTPIQGDNTHDLPRTDLISQSPRVSISTPNLHGSIALKGAVFDDLTLVKYRRDLAPDSPEVVLLSPSGNKEAYVAQLGWLAPDASIKTPDANTLWQASASTLTPQTPVSLRWNNGTGQTFEMTISVDQNYMFTIQQQVHNQTNAPIKITPYGFINRAYIEASKHNPIMHEGPLAVLQRKLEEIEYKQLIEEGKKIFPSSQGWVGVSDKYWLTALVPAPDASITPNFSHYQSKGAERFQMEYTADEQTIPASGSASVATHFFAGAKELPLLDAYSEKYSIPLFDRAVDLGILYFLTKPIFHLLNFFYIHIGNFGLSILALTVVIRLIMFPLANKSYKSMGQMKKLQPKMQELREKYPNDKLKMNQELIELYKREKVNPAAGCLPMLVQIPVFFALYKVLYVTIEMRHAPFFGWIHDLSAPDPTNIFTLFGLIAWNPPSILHIGILPVLMSITMIIQQKLNPPPSDPAQAKVLGMLPYIFLFLFASFPAGLVIYWIWSNTLSILQQYIITRRLHTAKK